MTKENVLVSIIIPVYNVNQWLDQCMESVMGQTFTKFEVLLINDGSTDGSDLKCRKWALKDNRVKYLSKENEGLSPTRNLGIREAKGKYIVFIDADDWLDIHFLEKLYNCITESEADIAECDIWRYNDITEEKTYSACYGHIGKEYTFEEHMIYGNTAIWKCMFKRSLFLENHIEFPDCHSPARAVYALLLALCNKIVNVREPLYYYRRFRKGSMTEDAQTKKGDEVLGLQAFECLIDGFKSHGLYRQYKLVLERIVKYKLSDILAAFFYRKDKVDFSVLASNYYLFVARQFPGSRNDTYITLGGYNLNRILWHMNLLHNPYCRFNFSSLIAVMHPLTEKIEFSHRNKYREIMVNRDIYSHFWDIIHEEDPNYIFIDFMEERFDVIQYKDAYITKSDALDDSTVNLRDIRVLPRTSEACTRLWKDSCRSFLDKIQREYSDLKIVLVKNYLCEQYGDIESRELYQNQKYIKEINYILELYYRFFEENCRNLIIVDASKSELYFTDRNYEYGTIPSHLNDITNRKIAETIEKGLIKENEEF